MWSAPDDLVQTIIKEAGKYAIDVGDDDMLGFQRHFKALLDAPPIKKMRGDAILVSPRLERMAICCIVPTR